SFAGSEEFRQPADRIENVLLHTRARSGVRASPLRRDGCHIDAGIAPGDGLAGQWEVRDLLFLLRNPQSEAARSIGGRVSHQPVERESNDFGRKHWVVGVADAAAESAG